MAKRVGNVVTVKMLREDGYSAAALRHFVFSTHYRKQLNLTDEALDASRNAVKRIGEFADRLGAASAGTSALAEVAREAEAELRAAILDDLNAPEALGALFTFLKRANAELDRGGDDRAALDEARRVFGLFDSVLDLVPEQGVDDAALATWVEERLQARKDARARRDFAAADAIRAELDARGIEVKDSAQGTRWTKVR